MADQDEKMGAVTEDMKNLDTDGKTKDGDVKEASSGKIPENASVDVGKENEQPSNEGEGQENEEELEKDDMNTCNHCKKDGPTKRCSKRHPKCLKKLFCNATCEELAL